MTKTKTIGVIIVLFCVLALALAVKVVCFPSVKDAYFAMDQGALQRAPGGLVVIHPTHFPLAVYRKGVIYTPEPGNPSRIMGRDLSLRDIIAAAWAEDRGQILMPSGAPTNNFDFIVTVSEPRKRLQQAIRSTFGYIADKETVKTDVLAMKVENPALPGLAVSAGDEKKGSNFKNERLYITHMQLKELTGGLEQILKTPVVDETGLTNYYDFSLAWNRQFLMRLWTESTARPAVDELLGGWGLALERDRASLEMLVVKKEN